MSRDLAPPVREITWGHNLVISGRSFDPMEGEFCIGMARKLGWSKEVLINQKKKRKSQGQQSEDVRDPEAFAP